MFGAIFAVLPLALGVIASPIGKFARQTTGSPCDGFGNAGFDVAYNFTLTAYNTTGPNAYTVGDPLVLGQAGAVDGAEFHVLSTFASYPYNDYPTFSLQNGALLPNAANGEPISVTDDPVSAGDAPGWVTGEDLSPPAEIYCGVADTDPAGGGTGYPQLAVNGDTDSFFLCKNGDYPAAQNNIVWKPSSGPYTGYLYDTCYPVVVEIVEPY